MKTKKQIKDRLRKLREEKAKYTQTTGRNIIIKLNKKIEELEWVLENNGK